MVYTFVVFGLECNFPAIPIRHCDKSHTASFIYHEAHAEPGRAVDVDKDLNRQQGMFQAFTVDGEAAMAFI